jgi:2-polyprenyl-3-methyl-5-hydroxy-6-metoxy-1,4-benzoquinol methylase
LRRTRARCEFVTVLDVPRAAIEATKKRLGQSADRVRWLTADISQFELLPAAYDVRHGRAVFHFLAVPEQRAAYVRQAARSVKPGGHVIVSTFGPEGPTKSSGLDVLRYDAEYPHSEFGSRVRLVAANDGDMPTLWPSSSTAARRHCESH